MSLERKKKKKRKEKYQNSEISALGNGSVTNWPLSVRYGTVSKRLFVTHLERVPPDWALSEYPSIRYERVQCYIKTPWMRKNPEGLSMSAYTGTSLPYIDTSTFHCRPIRPWGFPEL